MPPHAPAGPPDCDECEPVTDDMLVDVVPDQRVRVIHDPPCWHGRTGLDMEIMTIGQIGESYAKATVCDVIITVSRRAEDKQTHSGRRVSSE